MKKGFSQLVEIPLEVNHHGDENYEWLLDNKKNIWLLNAKYSLFSQFVMNWSWSFMV